MGQRNAIKEQQAQIVAQQEHNRKLEERLAELDARLSKISSITSTSQPNGDSAER